MKFFRQSYNENEAVPVAMDTMTSHNLTNNHRPAKPRTPVIIQEKIAGRVVCLCSVMRKPAICIWESKDADQLRSNFTAQLISDFDFVAKIVQSLFFLNQKFQASNHLIKLYSPVVENPEDRFSHICKV